MSRSPRAAAAAAVAVLGLLTAVGGCRARAPASDSAIASDPAITPRPRPVTRLSTPIGEEIIPGRALVELQAPLPELVGPNRAGLSAGAGLALAPPALVLGGVPVQPVRALLPGDDLGPPLWLMQLEAADPAGTWAALARLAADPRVRRVEPDRVRRRAAVPNDPHYRLQWGLKQIGAESAWDKTTGSSGVIVAVLDTGIIEDHPDLKARLVAGYDFISDVTNAGDGDGRDLNPHDEGTPDDTSSNLHGTHVAGIIGADTNNGRGVAGVDWRCRLMPVRVLGVRGGNGADSDIADALLWVAGEAVGAMKKVAQKADVANLSFGGLGVSFTVQRAVDVATARGVVVVAAAGNAGSDASQSSPGGLDRVITVGSLTRELARADYSNWGPRVDLVAPGGSALPNFDDAGVDEDGIVSTYRELGLPEPASMNLATYYALVGTSQATPHVSGAVALARALRPVQQLTTAFLLRHSAAKTQACDHDELSGCGAGVLNLPSFLELVRLQGNCSCTGDKLCQDGRCVDPGTPHPSLFADPVVHGGCQAAPTPTAPGLPGAALAGLGLLWARRRLRQSR